MFPNLVLNCESLDLVLERADLAHEVGSLVRCNSAGDDGAGNTLNDGKQGQ